MNEIPYWKWWYELILNLQYVIPKQLVGNELCMDQQLNVL